MSFVIIGGNMKNYIRYYPNTKNKGEPWKRRVSYL